MVEENPLEVWSGQIYQCVQHSISSVIPLVKQILPYPENQPVEVVYEKQYYVAHDVPS
jgi:hypothetical protein